MFVFALSAHQMLTLVLVAIATLVFYGIIRFIQVRRFYKDLPKPPHSFIFGHLSLLGELTKKFPPNVYIHHWLTVISQEYDLPDVFYLDLWPFSAPLLVICSPEMAAQVSTEQVFLKPKTVDDFLRPLLGANSIFTVDGREWKYLHSVFAPAFAPAQLRLLVDGMLEEVIVYHDRLLEHAKSGSTFSMEQANVALTFNVIGRAIFGSPFHTAEGEEFINDFRKAMNGLLAGAATNPIRRVLSRWTSGQLTPRVDEVIKNALTDRFKELKNAGRSDVKQMKSIMDLVLRQKLDATDDLRSDAPFLDMAVSNIKTFLLAGHETTAGTLCFIYMFLSKNPGVVREARREHDDVFSPDPNLTRDILREKPEKLNDMPYTTAIIKETLRLTPIGVAARAGGPGLHLMYGGRELPTDNQLIAICNFAMHHNPEIFECPSEFRPERFLPPSSVPKDAWRPFERGPRSCIGLDLAMTEMKIALLLALRTFDFETVGPEPNRTPRASYTDLDTIYGDQVFQEMGVGAKPKRGMQMKVKLASSKV